MSWQECCESAIRKGNITEFSALLSLGHKPCDINFLAQHSVRTANGQFMKILIESRYGQTIKMFQSREQKSILHLAAQNGCFVQSQLLLKNGLAVNIRDNFGNTPLHDALNSHALDVAALLLENGADWRIKNNKGLDCKDILGNHIIKYDLLTPEGKQMRDKAFQMMS